MLKAPFTTSFLTLFSLSVLAIDVGTSVASVSHENNYQVVGSFTLTINDDDFANASDDNPIYIRFTLSRSKGWSHSLVDLSRDDLPAINLAIYPEGQTTLNPAIPFTAVQLVRYKQGENSAWIKVTNSSSNWVQDGADYRGPSVSHPVSITVGVSALNSVRSGGHTYTNGNENSEYDILADTRLSVDYRDTPEFGNGDLETISFIAFDAQTRGVEDGSPSPGENLGIGFSNDFIVARAVDFFPCLEYHFEADDFQSTAPEVQVTELDLVQRRTYHVSVPGVYLTNSSDFDWDPGTSLFLVQDGYDPSYEMLGQTPPFTYDPSPGPTHLIDSTVRVESAEAGAVWSVSEVHWNGALMGYKLVLEEGQMTAFEPIKLSGMKVFTLSDFYLEEPLRLNAYSYWQAQGVNSPNQVPELGPLRRVSMTMVPASAPHQAVLPYTAYDRSDLSFEAHVVNVGDQPSRVTAVIRHPVGLMMLVIGEKQLGPNEKWSLPFSEWPDYKERYGWLAFYGEQPLSASGVLNAQDGSVFDIFVNPESMSHTLYGPHLPEDTANWQTSSYMVSPDPQIDPTVVYRLPGDDPQRVDEGFIIPSGTGVLDDTDFNGSQGRGSWFELDAGNGAVAGLMLYYRTGQHPLLASLPMPGAAETTWRFDHVGRPENGWWNGLVVTNPDSQNANVTLRGFDGDGNTLASVEFAVSPQQRVADIVANLLPEGIAPARIEVQSDTPVLSFLLMGRYEGNRLTTIPGNLSKGRKFVLPHMPSTDEFWSGLSLLNDNNEVVSVTITSYDQNGNSLEPIELQTQPGSRNLYDLAGLLGDRNPSHLVLDADAPISTYGLVGDTQNERLATLQFLMLNP